MYSFFKNRVFFAKLILFPLKNVFPSETTAHFPNRLGAISPPDLTRSEFVTTPTSAAKLDLDRQKKMLTGAAHSRIFFKATKPYVLSLFFVWADDIGFCRRRQKRRGTKLS